MTILISTTLCVLIKGSYIDKTNIHSILGVSNSNLRQTHANVKHSYVCMRAFVTPLWRQSRSEVLEATEAARSLAEDSLSSSPGKRPSLICKKWKEQRNCRGNCRKDFGLAVFLGCFFFLFHFIYLTLSSFMLGRLAAVWQVSFSGLDTV